MPHHLSILALGLTLAACAPEELSPLYQMSGDTSLQFGQLVGIATQQIEHVLGGPHRPLDTPQRQLTNKALHPLVGH